MELAICPHCGDSYYRELYTTIYKYGENIDPNKDMFMIHCLCCNCNKEFSYVKEY